MSDKKQPIKQPIASKWNAHYAFANKSLPEPAAVLFNGSAYLPDSGVALDLACGKGANAFYLAEKGLSVHAWDISSEAIELIHAYNQSLGKPVQVTPEVRDCIATPPEPDSFDVIVVSRFLDRPLCPKLSAALKPGGVLFYQTFTAGLSNPDYLLLSNELPELFADLQPCYSFETPVDEAGRREAYFVGRKRG